MFKDCDVDKRRKNDPATPEPKEATLGTNGVPWRLGEVEVAVTGRPVILPRQPDSESWPTSEMAFNIPVRMQNGQTWQVALPPHELKEGGVKVTLWLPTNRQMMSFVVPTDDLNVPIWDTGISRTIDQQDDPGSVVPDQDQDNPDPVSPANPSQTPLDGPNRPL